MTDWIDDAAKKAKEKYGAQAQADARFNTEQILKKELGDKYWTDLLARIQDQADKFNKVYEANAVSLKSQDDPNRCQIVVNFSSKLSRKVTLKYNPVTHSIVWTDHESTDPMTRQIKEIEFRLELITDQSIAAKYGTETFDPTAVATHIMSPLLKT